jgi:hypothetical protein
MSALTVGDDSPGRCLPTCRQDTSRSRLCRSRSEVAAVNLIQPRHSASASALSVPNPQSPEEHLPGTVHQHGCAVSPLTSLTVAAPCLCRRIDSPPDCPIGLVAPGSTATRSTRIAFSYRRSSGPSSSWPSPRTVPSNSPVFVKSAGALEALRNTGAMVAVIVRLPDAPVKRPVPPVI